tara:strand:- start:3553 stop:5373 length:1821 start_codon:yes stop_codon:yes gene_type:complete
MKIKPVQNSAPKQAMIAGEPHMLAYINEAERQMLKRAGGAEMPSFAGIPAYPPDRQSGTGANVSPASKARGAGSRARENRKKRLAEAQREAEERYQAQLRADEAAQRAAIQEQAQAEVREALQRSQNFDAAAGGNFATVPEPQGNSFAQTLANLFTPFDNQSYVNGVLMQTDTISEGQPYQYTATGVAPGQGLFNSQPSNMSEADQAAAADMAKSLIDAGFLSVGGKNTPLPPYQVGNPPILVYKDGQYTIDGSLAGDDVPFTFSYNADGSRYIPYNGGNPFDPNAASKNNPQGVNRFPFINALPNPNPDPNALPPVVGGTLPPGGSTFPPATNPPPIPPIAPPPTPPETPCPPGFKRVNGMCVPVGSKETPPPGTEPPPEEVNEELLAALALRDAALARQLGLLGNEFSFSTDDYYNRLGQSYRDGGLSEAFTTAYDDATRGIYDTFKAAGMLTQQGVDDKLGILAGAQSGEEGRIDSIVNQYMDANRNFVESGRNDLTSALQGLAYDSEDIPTINAQTAAINAFDVVGQSRPFKEPKEQEVVDFFTDFVKRAYDPSYNVDPTAVASGSPRRVTQSVNQRGANTAPSTIAGIFDPVSGGSVKVVN